MATPGLGVVAAVSAHTGAPRPAIMFLCKVATYAFIIQVSRYRLLQSILTSVWITRDVERLKLLSRRIAAFPRGRPFTTQ